MVAAETVLEEQVVYTRPASLRDVPKDKLPTAERMFISFLSGIPLNNGAFFVNQRLGGFAVIVRNDG